MTPVRVIDVHYLGEDAVVVEAGGKTIVLMDAATETDDRIEILNRVMAEVVTD